MGKIHIAAYTGDLATVKKLVEEGEYFYSSKVDVNLYEKVNIDGREWQLCPLDCAVLGGHLTIIEYLRSKSARGSRLLAYTLMKKRAHITNYVLNNFELNSKEIDECLEAASGSSDIKTVDLLIENKKSLIDIDKHFKAAVARSDLNIARLLIKHAKNPGNVNECFQLAVMNLDIKMMGFLISEAGADIMYQDPKFNNYRAIDIIMKSKNKPYWYEKFAPAFIYLMIKYKESGIYFDFDIIANVQRFYHIPADKKKICKQIIDEVYTDDTKLYSLILEACQVSQIEGFYFLVTCASSNRLMTMWTLKINKPFQGDDYIESDKQGPLVCSIFYNDIQKVQFFMENGANLDATINGKWTIMEFIKHLKRSSSEGAAKGYVKIEEYLLPYQLAKEQLDAERKKAEIEEKKLKEQQELNAKLTQLIELQAKSSVSSSALSKSNNNEDLGNISISFEINYNDIKKGKTLGQGSFGIVYAGEWANMTVAVKELQVKQLSEKHTQEFKNEAKIMANLASEHIVRLYAICTQPYCLVMEYMEKGSLHAVLHGQENLDWTMRKTMALDIAYGLSFLHAKDILHRDLKSLNVLINGQNRAKLTDFGLSTIKKETNSTSQQTSAVGTLLWMAPELFKRGGKHSPESDVYSLGIVLCELATRKVPFEDEENANQALIMQWITNGEHDDIPEDCPTPFGKLMVDCWKLKPSDRMPLPKVIEELRSMQSDYRDNLDTLTNSLTK